MKLYLVLALFAFLQLSQAAPKRAPPATWQEHWFDHVQVVKNVFTDNDVAVYFDNDVDPSITWPNKYIGDVWRYVKQTYGNFGEENNLYAVFHTGKYSGGHPSTYFDDSHDKRNVIDCGSNSANAWTSGKGNDLDIVTHEIAHVVEGACKGIHNSPAFPIWGDSKWAEIFNYDVYLSLGMTEDANRWKDMMMGGSEDFPTRGTYWFRDWFYPIYSLYGGSHVLNNYFEVLAANFPKNNGGYTRDLNLGEFVHFWSGAARKNLKSQAETAFQWNNDFQNQFDKARQDFPSINYD